MEPKYTHYVVCANPFCKAAFHEVDTTLANAGPQVVVAEGASLEADFTSPKPLQEMTKESLKEALSVWLQKANPNPIQAVKLNDVINNGLTADSIDKLDTVDTDEDKSTTAEETACKLIQRLVELNVLSEHAYSILEDEFNSLSTGEAFKGAVEGVGASVGETHTPDPINTLDAQYMEAQIRKLNAESHKLELENRLYVTERSQLQGD